ncbi:hypothetical protein J4410_02095 [Candidatus Woesearchaeota archaeon]|nr:hypothetical protein [Candidatus Woesearchaeota archaeon]
MFKKAQGLPLNVIVIAAIVLVVMVVIIAIFLGRAGQTGREIAKCENQGGQCMPGTRCNEAAGFVRIPEQCADDSTGEPQVCCRQIGSG